MPTLGLFGGAAPRIARRIRDQPLQYSDLPPVEEEASAPRGMRGVAGMFGKEMRAPIMASPQGAASPMAETAPSSVPSMGMMMKGPPKPKPQGSGIAEMFGYKGDASGMGALEWWFSPTARRDAAAKGVATQQALEQQRAEVNRQIQTLQEQGYAPDQIIAFMNNPEKWSESLATNLEAANVGEGDVRYFGNGQKPFAGPPKTGDNIRQVGNSILERQQDGSWKPVYTAETPQEAARAFSMFIDKKTGRQMFLMSDGQTKDTGIEAYIPTQITSVGGVPTAVDKRTLETSALSPLGDVAGNKAALASAEVQGKAQGQAAADLPGVELRTKTAISSIDALKKLNLNARYGAQSKIWAVPGTEGADVQARITQVTSQAFLNAFDQLKGAGAITETEGAAATAAITRLKDQNITVGEALTAMEDLQDYYAKGLAVAKLKARRAPTLPDRQASGVAGSSDDVSDLLEKYK